MKALTPAEIDALDDDQIVELRSIERPDEPPVQVTGKEMKRLVRDGVALPLPATEQ